MSTRHIHIMKKTIYNQQLLARVIALTEIANYLALPPDPREVMRKGVLMRVGTCADFVNGGGERRKTARERA